MVVVTTVSGQARSGCLVGFHGQCSIDPVRYAVSISRANHTYRIAVLAEMFAVHFLTPDDRDVAEDFGSTSGDDVGKFASWDWRPGEGGVPLLDRCPNRLVGRRPSMFEAGTDHTFIVLEPLSVQVTREFRPLGLAAVSDLTPGHGVDERQRD